MARLYEFHLENVRMLNDAREKSFKALESLLARPFQYEGILSTILDWGEDGYVSGELGNLLNTIPQTAKVRMSFQLLDVPEGLDTPIEPMSQEAWDRQEAESDEWRAKTSQNLKSIKEAYLKNRA